MWTTRMKESLEADFMDYMNPRHGALMSHDYEYLQRIVRAMKYLVRRQKRCHKSRNRRTSQSLHSGLH